MSYKATDRRLLKSFLCGVGCNRTLILGIEDEFLSRHQHYHHPSLYSLNELKRDVKPNHTINSIKCVTVRLDNVTVNVALIPRLQNSTALV